MRNVNPRKRRAHEKRVREALRDILNDPKVMPNADCRDLVVSVGEIVFGATVREIFANISGEWCVSPRSAQESPHEAYMREARAAGQRTYSDLTDVVYEPDLMRVVECELQRRLGLLYKPRIRALADLGELR